MASLGLSIVVLIAAITAQASANTSPIVVWAIPDEYFPTTALGVPGGFLGDLLNSLTKITGLTFNIQPHPELKYDSPNPDGSWTGTLIGAVSQANAGADLVGPDLTATPENQKVVDFLEPIQTYTLQIIVNKKFGLTDSVQYISIDDADLLALKESSNTTLNKIYQNVQNGRPGSIVDTNEAGVAKVLTGNFAFIGESVYFDRALKLTPGAVLAGGNLGGNYTLGFAVRKGWAITPTLNKALVQLKSSGALDALITKYSPNATVPGLISDLLD